MALLHVHPQRCPVCKLLRTKGAFPFSSAMKGAHVQVEVRNIFLVERVTSVKQYKLCKCLVTLTGSELKPSIQDGFLSNSTKTEVQSMPNFKRT